MLEVAQALLLGCLWRPAPSCFHVISKILLVYDFVSISRGKFEVFFHLYCALFVFAKCLPVLKFGSLFFHVVSITFLAESLPENAFPGLNHPLYSPLIAPRRLSGSGLFP